MPEWGTKHRLRCNQSFQTFLKDLSSHLALRKAVSISGSFSCFFFSFVGPPPVLQLQLWSLNTSKIHTAMVRDTFNTVKVKFRNEIPFYFLCHNAEKKKKKKIFSRKILLKFLSMCFETGLKSLVEYELHPDGIHSQVTELKRINFASKKSIVWYRN